MAFLIDKSLTMILGRQSLSTIPKESPICNLQSSMAGAEPKSQRIILGRSGGLERGSDVIDDGKKVSRRSRRGSESKCLGRREVAI
jgi:hypothetical protein